MQKWYRNTGNHGDVVLSSNVKLARNISGVPFPVRLNPTRRMALNNRVCGVLAEANQRLRIIDMSMLYPYEAVSLAEQYLISPEFAAKTEGRVLLLSENEDISIMLCEEDHILIQAVEGGLRPEKACQNAEKYENILDMGLHFAFDNKLGYLTQNPVNLGTGLSASVLLHLPALSRTGAMTALSSMVSKLGFSMRGAYGDGVSVRGDLYRLSNTVSLGINENEAISNLKSLALQLATKERSAAEAYVKDINVKDKINRASALLSAAMLLTTDEMLEMLSYIRLGSLYGLNSIKPESINELFITMQPATVNCKAGKKLTSAERDEIRAEIVRKTLFG